MSHLITAIIFVPAHLLDPHGAICVAHCEAHGYEVVGLVTTTWADAHQAQVELGAAVIVVSSTEHIPADAEPRLEIVAQAHTVHMPRRERTRLIRRDAAE